MQKREQTIQVYFYARKTDRSYWSDVYVGKPEKVAECFREVHSLWGFLQAMQTAEAFRPDEVGACRRLGPTLKCYDGPEGHPVADCVYSIREGEVGPRYDADLSGRK